MPLYANSTSKEVTAKVCEAFRSGLRLNVGNFSTNSKKLFLNDNLIAEIRDDGLWFTMAGYPTKLTKERLKGLGIRIGIRKEELYWIREDKTKVLIHEDQWIKV